MFQHWLKGNGKRPVSWKTLLEILEDCHFGNLAAQVRTALMGGEKGSSSTPAQQ
jgi:hypothetical protein